MSTDNTTEDSRPHRGINPQVDYWNGIEATHWLEHEKRYDQMLEPYVPRLLDAASISTRTGILDIGCGCGATTLAAARSAPSAHVTGIDLSRPMLDRARQRAHDESLTNVDFELGDAEAHPFRVGALDAVISRFGVMFFTNPPAAFINIARALAPGGTLALVCWQEPLANEWITVPGGAAANHIALAPLEDETTGGPFAFADPDYVTELLRSAGFHDVGLSPVDEPLILGTDPADTVAFLMQTGMGRRLLEGLDEDVVAEVQAAIEEALIPFMTPRGVSLGSAAWLATARR